MSKRKWFVFLSSVLLIVLLLGCPMDMSSLAGAWKVSLHFDCDTATQSILGIVLYPDGTAELYDEGVYVGTWSLNGSVVTITLVSPSAYTFTGTVSMDGDSIIDGNYTGTYSGCWTAEKIKF